MSAAFTNSNNQQKPVRKYKKDVSTDRYFVFDHDNRLLSSNNYNELCILLYPDRNINQNMHFMMAQKHSSLQIQCDNVYKDRVVLRTFFNIDDVLDIAAADKMETIYDITCRTNMNIEGYGLKCE